MDWDSMSHTRGILLAVQPRLPDDVFEQRIHFVESSVRIVEQFCEEYDIDVPETAIMIDTDAQTIELVQSPADRLRWYQVLHKMQTEYQHLHDKGDL